MQRKPVDLGNGTVCASFGVDGCLLAVSAPHREVGIVELTAAPVFPFEHDGDGVAVRRHRASLADSDHAVLRVADSSGRLIGDQRRWRCEGRGWSADVDAWAMSNRPVVVQRFRVQRHGTGRLRIVFTGRLDRPDYAEITPVGRIPAPWARGAVTAQGRVLEVVTAQSGPQASAVIEASVRDVHPGRWHVQEGAASFELAWEGGAPSFEVQVTVTLRTPGRTDAATTGAPGPLPPVAPPEPPREVPERIATGAVYYTRSCTALAVDDVHCCILTDHRLLPLSWTRDAYYQAALLLCPTDADPDTLSVDVVRRHLMWTWGPGRDPAGVWQRSHFASGAVKDAAFQADQQLYPLLELADFRRMAGTWPTLPGSGDDDRPGDPAGWGAFVRGVWDSLPRGPGGLLPGDENPADDASGLPYLLSSQLLLAYVGRRLAEWAQELGVESLHLSEDATRTLTSISTAFECDGPYGPQWAYEADGGDGRRLYHDANDVPAALAPLWGLCAMDDPHWRATMRFAWSAHNSGFVPGPFGGLGSAHTPGVWALGDAQEWAVAQTTGDAAAAARVHARLQLVTSDDGMLPETYDPDTGEWLARHWFAWPGSLLGLLHRTIRDGTGPWVR